MLLKNQGSQRKKKGSAKKKNNIQTVQISKIDESYNTDKGPENFNNKDDFNDHKGNLQDIPSESSSVFSTKVIYIL